MARDLKFKILEDGFSEWLFRVEDNKHRHPEASINYRHVIWHALMDFARQTNTNEDNCEEMIEKLVYSFDENENFNEVGFVTLYMLNIEGNGWLLIDRSRWCYPLVFDDPYRVKALGYALNDTLENFSGIYAEIISAKEWDKDFQDKINEFDSYPSNSMPHPDQ